MTVYCIPGLGTDYRVFQNLIPQLPFEKVVYLDFREDLMHKGEGMADYAARLAADIEAQPDYNPGQPPYLLGLSLGGLVAVELAKILPHAQLLLISTAKRQAELPAIIKLARRLPLYKIMPAWASRNITPVLSRLAGVTDKPGYYLYRKMLKGWSAKMFAWGRHAAVNWQNDYVPAQHIHIHGTRDHIFNHRRIDATYLIPKGSHYMIMRRADEIAHLLRTELDEKKKNNNSQVN